MLSIKVTDVWGWVMGYKYLGGNKNRSVSPFGQMDVHYYGGPTEAGNPSDYRGYKA